MLAKIYIKEVMKHLKDGAILFIREKINKIFDKANKTLVDLGDTLSNNESQFIRELIETRAILTPKILIKDHKKRNAEGLYPTRLVVPATNFTVGSLNLDIKGLSGSLTKTRSNIPKIP